jgi:hypothetical protein
MKKFKASFTHATIDGEKNIEVTVTARDHYEAATAIERKYSSELRSAFVVNLSVTELED